VFERSLELLQELPPDVRHVIPALHNWELNRRLRQLDYLLEQARFRANEPAADVEIAVERAITYAECFYLIAWRVRLALTSHGKPLGPFEPEGVKQVRNWLIVHPDRHMDSPPLPSWAVSGDGDIRLSLGAQWTGAAGIPDTPRPTYRDSGLLANADEFRAKLEEFLERARERLRDR